MVLTIVLLYGLSFNSFFIDTLTPTTRIEYTPRCFQFILHWYENTTEDRHNKPIQLSIHSSLILIIPLQGVLVGKNLSIHSSLIQNPCEKAANAQEKTFNSFFIDTSNTTSREPRPRGDAFQFILHWYRLGKPVFIGLPDFFQFILHWYHWGWADTA